jgi:serine/threonine protein kinase
MLTDYSLASRLEREDANIMDVQGTRRSLAYLPPEATGRVNKAVDYRADFYSLGVVFYEVPSLHRQLNPALCRFPPLPRKKSAINDP